jgi:REP element-mobilizing transposase RayT
MARRRRVHIPNSFVHVSHRCNHGDPLLEDPKVRAIFLQVLQEVVIKFGYEVLYYCVQDNHIHLILFTPPQIEGRTLSSFMHRLDTTFGHRLNAWKGWHGSTWEGRYSATGWVPIQQLAVLEILLWYAATNTARRKVNAVPAAAWPWGTAYWLARGEEGPVRTTLRSWLECLYESRGSDDPVQEFLRLAEQTDRPDWQAKWAELARRGLPWQGPPPDPDRKIVQHDLKGLLDKIRALNLRSWKLEVERYSMLLLPLCQVKI